MRVAVLIATVIVGLSLAACATQNSASSPEGAPAAVPASKWIIDQEPDRTTGAPSGRASVVIPNAKNTAVDFARPAIMQLLCFRGEPIVRIEFNFRIGSTRNSSLGYRFDERPGLEVQARILNDYRTLAIEDPATVRAFVDEMRTANILYLSINSLNAGRTAADFPVAGAAPAIESAYARCPLPDTYAQPPKPSPPRGRGRGGSPM